MNYICLLYTSCLFEKAENSSFLKGANNRNWSATFDWLIKDSNMAKTLDGNYDDRPTQRNDYGERNNNPFFELINNCLLYTSMKKESLKEQKCTEKMIILVVHVIAN